MPRARLQRRRRRCVPPSSPTPNPSQSSQLTPPPPTVLYSAGTDSLLKAFSSTTGQVSAKLHIPSCNGSPDHPTLLHALSPQTLLLATDSAALHLLDLRTPGAFASAAPAQTHRPHDDYISSLAPLPATAASTSGVAKQWVTTGGTTLAVTDLRRGVLVKSADQEEELLSCAVVGGFPAHGGQSGGQKVVVGNGNGVLTLWERGVWDDQDERVVVTPGGKAAGESVDAIAVVPGGRREVVVGCGDGKVRVVNLTGRGVLGVLRHDELEGVVGVGFDCYGRLISGGGNMVKVWGEKGPEAGEGEEESDSEKDSEKDSEDSEDESSSSEEEEKPERKKRKKGRGKADPGVGNGILGFQGMD